MDVPQFARYEQAFEHAADVSNPYRQITATAHIVGPDRRSRSPIMLFWDGGRTWRLRFSPDQIGTWHWETRSTDSGLDGHSGAFEVVPSDLKGSIRPMAGHPTTFNDRTARAFGFWARRRGRCTWTAQSSGTTARPPSAHRRARGAGLQRLAQHAAQRGGLGQQRGASFRPTWRQERINPAYWQEVDRRLAYLNHQGIVGGLVLAWGRKQLGGRASSPMPGTASPSLEAKLRYARTIAARYSAYDVYLIVAGEWNASSREKGRTGNAVHGEYIRDRRRPARGRSAPAHDRHPPRLPAAIICAASSTSGADWMDFGDYQQNYVHLNAEIVASRGFRQAGGQQRVRLLYAGRRARMAWSTSPTARAWTSRATPRGTL